MMRDAVAALPPGLATLGAIAQRAATALFGTPPPDAAPIWIRNLRGDDGPLLDAFVRELSPAARQMRFHHGVRQLSAPMLDRLTHYDLRLEAALLATRAHGDVEVGVGEARYALVDGDDGAREFAIAVADDARGRGVGTRLLRTLIGHARRGGVQRLYGDVLRDNVPMLKLARKLGFTVRRHPGDARLQRVELLLQGG
jgi:acetyltransferase